MSSEPDVVGDVEPDVEPDVIESRWHYRRSLASRVTLLTTIAVGLSVAFVAAGAFWTVKAQLQQSLDSSLESRAQAAAASSALDDMVGGGGGGLSSTDLLGAGDIRIVFYNRTEYLYFDRGPTMPLGTPEYDVLVGKTKSSVRTVTAADGTRYRVVAVPSAVRKGEAVALAQPLASQERVLHRLGLVMLLFGLAGVIAAAVAGWGVARNGLRPVRKLTSRVEDIARTEDLTPLPVEGADEIARLATAFNVMLTALSASRDRQKQLVADAGHELRTPLTSLRTNIDLLTQADAEGGRSLPPQARTELLADVRAQIEELTTLIGDLVELARDEPAPRVVSSVDLPLVVEHAISRVRRRAPSVRFEADLRPWWVVGESNSLERAVTNLLDNAAKWSPTAGTVRVSLIGGTLTVDDEGSGIAEADLHLVFDRFYRSTESRSMPGSGLGLSIVRAVADRHSGTVQAGRSPSGGARLELHLPGAATAAPSYRPTLATASR